MPSLNKASLRQEFDSLKGEFERLCAAGQMAQESRALVQALLALFELLMAVFMEKHTPKHSRNSSRPSSQMEKADETATRPGSKTKGQGEHQGRCRNTRTLETVERSPVSTCAGCGQDLRKTSCQGHERRTLVDIVFEKHLRHVDAQIKRCPACQSLNKRSVSRRSWLDRFSTGPASRPM